MKRLRRITKEVIYIGSINQDTILERINGVLISLPKYLKYTKGNIEFLEVENDKVITFDLLLYVLKGIVSDNEANKVLEDVQSRISEIFEDELKNQHVIYKF